MSEIITIARSYAKAAFDFAVEREDVLHWQSMLAFSAEVSRNKLVTEMLLNGVSSEQLVKTFIAVCSTELDTFGQNLIRVMAKNKRLTILPDVLDQFILLRLAKEKIVLIDVVSIKALKKEQLEKISLAMEKRLSRKVKLSCKVDESIMAGLVIRNGNMVIDGSVRGRLERLADILQN